MLRKKSGYAFLLAFVLSVLGVAFCPDRSNAETHSLFFTPPPKGSYPAGPLGDLVKKGEEVFVNTGKSVPGYTGNRLTCASCHLDHGRKPYAAPMWAAYVMYPEFDKKTHKTVWLDDKIRMCFKNSLNAAPPDRETVKALDTYIFWLAKGAPIGHELKGRGYVAISVPDKERGFFRGPQHLRLPDTLKGFELYSKRCASCHGASGQGKDGSHMSWPLWGSSSYTMKSGLRACQITSVYFVNDRPIVHN